MPTFKNVSPRGDLELVLHAQYTDDGEKVTGQRIVFVNVGDLVEVSKDEAKLLEGQNYNWQKLTVEEAKTEQARIDAEQKAVEAKAIKEAKESGE
jgi:hypothetical protein